MNTGSIWRKDVLPLPRPEYAKQAEALLTDLIWRSNGSILSGSGGGFPYLKELGKLTRSQNQPFKKLPAMDRLILRRTEGASADLVQTGPIAEKTPLDKLILTTGGAPTPTKALIESIIAPRARGDRSLACVPIHPNAVVLQTLHGLVNKPQPPDMSEAIEVMGRLGGASYKGEVASYFLGIVSQHVEPAEGLTGLIEALLESISQHVWGILPTWPDLDSSQPVSSFPKWPVPIRSVMPPISSEAPLVLASQRLTPFSWFWLKWNKLCGPASKWYDILPTRRFVDWCLCLLRTGLAFSYLWEADFFCKLHETLQEQKKTPGSQLIKSPIHKMLNEGALLARFENARVPASQKDVGKALSLRLARGYEARDLLGMYGSAPSFSSGENFSKDIADWTASISSQDLSVLAEPLNIRRESAENTRELVRYLLLPRSSNDDSVDQADFYYLARTNSSKQFWFQPGPEWLVVITSLLCDAPGGQCTLRMLLQDLTRLGVRVERSVLVEMLEEAGLSVDSPDADNALVIRSAF